MSTSSTRVLVAAFLSGVAGCSWAESDTGSSSAPIGATMIEAVAMGPNALTYNGVTYPEQRLVLPVNDRPNPYERVWPWGELPTGAIDPGDYDARASFIGIVEGSDGTIYALSRCMANSCEGRPEAPLMAFDPDGRLLRSWGEGLMSFPHGLGMDREGNLWVADQGGHQAFKFSPDGQLLMTLGTKGMEGDPAGGRLTEPTAVAVAPNGDVFITEGHNNAPDARVARVSKFAPSGTFIMSWGQTGSGIGEFSTPHSIAFDSQGRVFVADRNNNRIQIFDQQGNFLDLWYQFGRPSGIAISSDDRMYVADSESYDFHNPGWLKGIRIGSARTGVVDSFIVDLEPTTISHSGAEAVGFDSRGNVYGGVVRRRMLEKHVPTRLTDAP
jgi:sugar lactone lactonase YvrE